VYRADGFPMAFAGIWATWKDPETGESSGRVRSSPGASGPIAAIHDRMPVILVPDVWDAWLDRDLTDPHEAERLLQPIDADSIHEHPVSSEVNSVRNNHARLTEPAPNSGCSDRSALWKWTHASDLTLGTWCFPGTRWGVRWR
jgi:putative SOS response-associated peptidase YedK